MSRPTYHHVWQDFQPDPLADQIEEAEAQLSITSHVLNKKQAAGQIHPHIVATRLHRLRSIIHTLKQQQAGAEVGAS